MNELDWFPIIRTSFPRVKLARRGFVFGLSFTQDNFRRIWSRFVRQKRRFSCWLSLGNLENRLTTFSSRSARFQLEITHLGVINLESFENFIPSGTNLDKTPKTQFDCW